MDNKLIINNESFVNSYKYLENEISNSIDNYDINNNKTFSSIWKLYK